MQMEESQECLKECEHNQEELPVKCYIQQRQGRKFTGGRYGSPTKIDTAF